MRSRWIVATLTVLFAVLGGAYWFATGGMPARRARPEWLTARPFAHRGLYGQGPQRPENSLEAFRAAVGAGYPVELDVHLTADGGLVVIHDDTLERMTGDPREVGEVKLVELRTLRLLHGPERIPTLGEVLDAVGGRVPVLVELKNRGDAGALEEGVAEALEEYRGEAAVISFNPYSLAYMAMIAPDVPRGQLSGTFEGEDVAPHERFALRHLLMNWKSRPAFVAYELDALPYLGTSLQRLRGRPLLAWTADSPEERARGTSVADGVICDPMALR